MRHLKSCIRTPHHFIIILPIFLTFFCGWWTSEAISTAKNWRNEEERQLAAFLSFFLSFFLSDFLSFCFGLWKSVGNDKDQDILHLKTGQRHRGNPLTLVVFLHFLARSLHPPSPTRSLFALSPYAWLLVSIAKKKERNRNRNRKMKRKCCRSSFILICQLGSEELRNSSSFHLSTGFHLPTSTRHPATFSFGADHPISSAETIDRWPFPISTSQCSSVIFCSLNPNAKADRFLEQQPPIPMPSLPGTASINAWKMIDSNR